MAAGASLAVQLRGDAVDVAPRLLGAVLSSDVDGAVVGVRITEVEAYEGLADPASHAFRGPTARTAVMFGPAGYLYCYFVYGMHWCANVVVGEPGLAGAVLLRGGEVVEGLLTARLRGSGRSTDHALARGPARLARTLGLSREHNGVNLLADASPVRLLSLGRPADYCTGPRVGIRAAADRPWRFWLADEPSVSAYRTAPERRPVARRQTELS